MEIKTESGHSQEGSKNASGEQLNGLRRILTPRQLSRLGSVQDKARKGLERCFLGTASPRAAIKMMCLECVGYDRAAVGSCADRCCPLWAYRPFQA